MRKKSHSLSLCFPCIAIRAYLDNLMHKKKYIPFPFPDTVKLPLWQQVLSRHTVHPATVDFFPKCSPYIRLFIEGPVDPAVSILLYDIDEPYDSILVCGSALFLTSFHYVKPTSMKKAAKPHRLYRCSISATQFV